MVNLFVHGSPNTRPIIQGLKFSENHRINSPNDSHNTEIQFLSLNHVVTVAFSSLILAKINQIEALQHSASDLIQWNPFYSINSVKH